MPLMKGHSQEVVGSNIKELVKSGKKPKKAIAIALSHARKYKKMAEGGEVGSIDEGEEGKPGDAVYPEGSDDQGLSENVMDAQALAEGLQAERYKANDNTVSYEADDTVSGSKMNKGGIVQSEHGMPQGNKPELDWIDASTEEPMSDEPSKPSALDHSIESSVPMSLSEEAKKAIMEKKMKRKYGMYSPK